MRKRGKNIKWEKKWCLVDEKKRKKIKWEKKEFRRNGKRKLYSEIEMREGERDSIYEGIWRVVWGYDKNPLKLISYR